ncbi:hypothetical protein TIFTF001_000464 [Ficus carica]|uniref:Uncharacterized protein n=1 Tax=Ficus carica TaxID=3494 RepID=A0AA87ZDI3_FICCA|nr:hypothetical protein TIFTF001_000464 [Ficus carica]
MLLSEKDLINAADHFDFLVRPTLEFRHDQCQIALSDQEDSEENQMQKYQQQQQNRKDQKDQKEGDKFDMLASTLKLKIPTSEEFRSSSVAVIEDQENVDHAAVLDGFKTPTSLDHKIPATLKCPPAPRKPKSLPSTKRKVAARRRVLLDLASEIELLFPPAILADLGGKIKKVRQGSTGNIIL